MPNLDLSTRRYETNIFNYETIIINLQKYWSTIFKNITSIGKRIDPD